MKYVKMLGLVAAAPMAPMAFGPGRASAITLRSPKGSTYKGEIVASAEGTVTMTESGFGTVTCTEGVVKRHPGPPSDTTTVTGAISTLTYGKPRAANGEESQCEKGAAMINILKRGLLDLHAIGSGPNGTPTSSGTSQRLSPASTASTQPLTPIPSSSQAAPRRVAE